MILYTKNGHTNRVAPVFALGILLFILVLISPGKSAASANTLITPPENTENMFIQISSNGRSITFKLNNSRAAKEFYNQLPLSIDVENYGGKEKIFYPPKKLGTSQTPMADAKAGTLAYYAPWGDVVMFYKDFGSAAGLYELGQAVSGSEYIRDISGEIELKKVQ